MTLALKSFTFLEKLNYLVLSNNLRNISSHIGLLSNSIIPFNCPYWFILLLKKYFTWFITAKSQIKKERSPTWSYIINDFSLFILEGMVALKIRTRVIKIDELLTERGKPGPECRATTCGPALLHTSSKAQPTHTQEPAIIHGHNFVVVSFLFSFFWKFGALQHKPYWKI